MVKRLKDGTPQERIDWQRVAGDDAERQPARRAPFRFGPQHQPPEDSSGPAIDPWKELLERGSMHEVLASVRRVSGLSDRVEVRPARRADPEPGKERERRPAPSPTSRRTEADRPAPAPSRPAAPSVPRFAAPPAEPAPQAPKARQASRPAAERPDPKVGAAEPTRPRIIDPAAPPAGPKRTPAEPVRPTDPAAAPAWPEERTDGRSTQVQRNVRQVLAGPPRASAQPVGPPRPAVAGDPGESPPAEREPAPPDRRLERADKPPPSADRAGWSGERQDDRSDEASRAQHSDRIGLDFVPRRLVVPSAPPAPRRGFRRFGAIALVIIALGVGIGFGLAREGADWSLPWPQLTAERSDLEAVRPAGGPLPAPPAEETGGQGDVRPAPAGGADGIPIPSRRPTVEPSSSGSQLATAVASDEVVETGLNGDDAGQLPPLFLGRVFVHYAGPANDEVSRERAERIARALEAEGYRIGAIRPAGFAIRTSSVRYFFDTDRIAAARLRDDLPPTLAEQTLMMDFTSYEPRPRPGTIELWLADAG